MMDAQTRVRGHRRAGRARAVPGAARGRAGGARSAPPTRPEVVAENRFIAARDGMGALRSSTRPWGRRPVRERLARAASTRASRSPARWAARTSWRAWPRWPQSPGAARQRAIAERAADSRAWSRRSATSSVERELSTYPPPGERTSTTRGSEASIAHARPGPRARAREHHADDPPRDVSTGAPESPGSTSARSSSTGRRPRLTRRSAASARRDHARVVAPPSRTSRRRQTPARAAARDRAGRRAAARVAGRPSTVTSPRRSTCATVTTRPSPATKPVRRGRAPTAHLRRRPAPRGGAAATAGASSAPRRAQRASSRRPGRVADHERRLGQPQLGRRAAVEPLEQQLEREPAHLAPRLVDRRQRDVVQRGEERVVEADDRDVAAARARRRPRAGRARRRRRGRWRRRSRSAARRAASSCSAARTPAGVGELAGDHRARAARARPRASPAGSPPGAAPRRRRGRRRCARSARGRARRGGARPAARRAPRRSRRSRPRRCAGSGR